MPASNQDPPARFHLMRNKSGEELVVYHYPGKIILLPFGLLFAWCSFAATAVLMFGPRWVLSPLKNDVAIQFIIFCGWAAVTAFAIFALGRYFCATTFRLNTSNLTVHRRVFGLFTWKRQIHRSNMTCFEQIQDVREDAENSASWGLIVRGPGRQPLLSRETLEASDWLGPRLADFYGVEFKPCPARK